MKKSFFFIMLYAVAMMMTVHDAFAQESEMITLKATDINGLYKTKNKNYVSVHDPSVVYDPSSKFFYIYGTHNGTARSSDMQSWTGLSDNFYGIVNANGTITNAAPDRAFITNRTTKVKALVNGVVKEVNFGPFDAQAYCTATGTSVYGNMWAPDIIYNPTMKKWCLYLSLNGPRWNCVIILLTSSSITGPFVYQGPVVFSGFNVENNTTVDRTKTDLPLVLGNNDLPSRYSVGGGWGNFWPNCIDPCVFYDANGQLWMAYGSWSGGIFIFKLDPTTGLRDYTVTYPVQTNNGHAVSDPYFGKHIAGGYYVSGEGSYIQKIGDYYYLFVTNGGLEAKNGYVMRVFRSSNPDGPFVDAKGKSAVYDYYSMNYSTNDAETRGNLLVTSHNKLGFQTVGQVAQGHNSAIVTDDGRAFVVYHTRFDQGNEGHQVRVRQLFTNKEGWLLAAPFEYNGETLTDDSIKNGCKFTDKQISGEYQIHLLRYKLDNQNLECVLPKTIHLLENGNISGDYTGKWSMTEGTGYISLTIGGIKYSGVVIEQMYDGTTLKSISFTASSTSGTVAWGVKMQPQYAIAYNLTKITSPVKDKSTISGNIDLTATTYFGVRYEWVSSNPDVISNTGKYNPIDEDVPMTLTSRLIADNYVYETKYNVTAKADTHLEGDVVTGMMAYYDFNDTPLLNRLNTSQRGTFGSLTNGVSPSLVEDGLMIGKVGSVQGGTVAEKTGGYIRMPNPLYEHENLEGATVSMWVKRMDDNMFGNLWSFTEKLPTMASSSPRFFITSNNYVGYTNLTDTFAINYPKSARADITKGKWVLVTLTVDPENGVFVYVNGVKRTRTFTSTMGTLEEFDFNKVFSTLTSAKYFSIGLGNNIAIADAYYDDLLIYDRALTSDDVKLLYSLERRETDFVEMATSIEDVMAYDKVIPDGIYDLSGRKIEAKSSAELKRGIYVICSDGVSIKVIIR